MLLGSIQLMENPERVGFKARPSLVRLFSLDDLLDGRLGESDLAGCVALPKTGSLTWLSAPHVAEDRKLAVLRRCLGKRGSKPRAQLEREMVESRAQALQCISDERRDWMAREISGFEPNALVARLLRVWQLPNALAHFVPKEANLAVEPLQVFPCPREL